MMTRNEFMKGCAVACAAGLGCSGSARQARAAEEVGCSEELTQIKNRSDAAQLRFARLIETLENNVPAEERKHLLHALGTKCSDTYRPALIDRYIGNLKGFLEQGGRQRAVVQLPDGEGGRNAGQFLRLHSRLAGGNLRTDCRPAGEGGTGRVNSARRQAVRVSDANTLSRHQAEACNCDPRETGLQS
jgi:hypothetical protein